jgi:SAM-dependent methyltransferase
MLAWSMPSSDIAAKIRRLSSRSRKILSALMHQVFDKAYYQFLFGVQIPYAPSLNRKLASLASRRLGGDTPMPREVWESQYRDGDWGYLQGLDELTRYTVIAGYIQALKQNACILDVGCGEGILLEKLAGSGYCKFVGIDIAQSAIDRAEKKQLERSYFAQADAQVFNSKEVFDVVIFNEVLYYFRDPLTVAAKYRAWLKPGGFLITSMYAESDRARAISRMLKKSYHAVGEVEISSNGARWIIDILSPSHGEPQFMNVARII